jgi:serine phosphatase RsbU (regulator of sigma subunit)
VFSNGEWSELAGRDPALNIGDGNDFGQYSYQLAPGDLLVVYTDGFVETADKNDEMFGTSRLVARVAASAGKSLRAIREEIFAAVDAFSAPRGHQDDMSLILLRREVP